MTITVDMTNLATRSIVHQLQLMHALRLYQASGILVTRGATPSRILRFVEDYTGKTYKNTPAGRDSAIEDLRTIIDETKAARAAIAAAAPGNCRL